MEPNQSKSHQMKRAGDNDGSPVNKCERLEPSDESVPKVAKITDLNDDCLVKIFGRLDLQSLFNVAIANEWLRPAARDVYRRKYGGTRVVISECDDYRPITRTINRNCREGELQPLEEVYGIIEICGLKTCLLYLRCFGSSISNLEIDYNQSTSNRYGYVHQYINDYCAESLTEISFFRMANIAIEQFQKTFANVQSIKISWCDLKEQLSSFSTWFPNMRRFYAVRMENRCIATPFQHLTDLRISSCFSIMELKGNFADLLRMNRQLRILKVNMVDDDAPSANDLLDAIMHNASLTELSVVSFDNTYRHMDSAAVQQLVSEHPELVDLWLPVFRFDVDDVFGLIHQLNSLKKFKFWIKSSEYSRLEAQFKNSEWRTKGYPHWDTNQPDCIVTLNRSID